MTQLAALNVKISGDSADLQSDLSQAKTQLNSFEASAGKATKRTAGFSGSLGKLSNVSGQTRAQIQNTSFQLQDIAVQLQGGTRASTVFAQQLPQLLGAFGAVGAIAGVLAGVGIPALAFAFSAAGEEAETFDERLSALKDIQDQLKQSTDILSMSVEELEENYGKGHRRVLEFALAQAQLQASLAASRMNDQVQLLDDAASKYTKAQKAGRDYANTIARIERDFSLANKEAKQFELLLGAVTEAETFDEQQVALQNMLGFLKQNNVEMDKVPVSLKQAISDMITLSNETDRAQKFMRDLANASGDVTTGTPLFSLGLTGEELLPPTGEGDGNGGGGRARKDPLVGELERLEQSLMSKEELQIASFDRQQETLTNALEQQLLTKQEYDALMEDAEAQHSQRMADLAVYQYGDTLAQTGAFMGAMASAMQSGNDKMLKVARVFGAAEALINSYRAYNQVIADPTLPWFAKIPAAVSVLGAGLGMVNAIKGVSAGGGAGAASGGAAGATGAAAQAAPQTSNNVAISLTGGDMFSRDQVIQLINGINDAVDDGAQIRLV